MVICNTRALYPYMCICTFVVFLSLSLSLCLERSLSISLRLSPRIHIYVDLYVSGCLCVWVSLSLSLPSLPLPRFAQSESRLAWSAQDWVAHPTVPDARNTKCMSMLQAGRSPICGMREARKLALIEYICLTNQHGAL